MDTHTDIFKALRWLLDEVLEPFPESNLYQDYADDYDDRLHQFDIPGLTPPIRECWDGDYSAAIDVVEKFLKYYGR